LSIFTVKDHETNNAGIHVLQIPALQVITNDLGTSERGTLSIQGGPGGPGLQDGTGRDRKGFGVENAFPKSTIERIYGCV
jgi:hypothetical protein